MDAMSPWAPMCGQTWTDAAATFLGGWIVMMGAMMLPSLVTALRRYRGDVRRAGAVRLGASTALVSLGYLAVWTLCGAALYPLGVAATIVVARWPALSAATPVVAGLVVLIAGAVQFTAWKAHHLACCRATPACAHGGAGNLVNAWRHGLRLGWHCTACCAGPTASLLAIGLMNRYAMAAVTVAIAAERLAPRDARIVQAIGGAAIGTGLFVVARAAVF